MWKLKEETRREIEEQQQERAHEEIENLLDERGHRWTKDLKLHELDRNNRDGNGKRIAKAIKEKNYPKT